MCLALSPPSAGAFAQQQLRVARCSTAAPPRSLAAYTDVYTSAPPSGRASLVCAAVARRRRSSSLDRTTNQLETTRARGAAAKRDAKFGYRVFTTATAVSQGVLNVGWLLNGLGLDWQVDNGCFVETGCPFLTYKNNMQEVDVTVTIYVVVDGCRRPLEGAEIFGKVRNDHVLAEFRMRGLKKPLKDMGVVKGDPLWLTGYYSEDGRTLSVELEVLKTFAAPPQAVGPKLMYMEANKATAPVVALPAPSEQLMTLQERQHGQEVAMPVAAPEPEPTATAQVEAQAADVTSRPGTTYITNNYYTYNYHHHHHYNRGNDLCGNNQQEANEGHSSGGW